MEHRRHQDVIHGHHRDGGCDSGDGVLHVAAGVEPQNGVEGCIGRQHRERPVADVEDLDVPGTPVLQPFRNVLDQAHERDELRRKQHRGGDQEDDRRVVRLVSRRAYDEELRHRRDQAEDDEGRPPMRMWVEPREQRDDREGGRKRDDHEVRSRLGCELRGPLSDRGLDILENRARDRAQAALSPARLRLSSKLVIACFPSPISRTACGAARTEVTSVAKHANGSPLTEATPPAMGSHPPFSVRLEYPPKE